MFELQEDLITYVNTRYEIFINCVWRIIVKTQKVSHQFGENLRKRLVYDRQTTIKTVVSRHYNCGKLIISIYLLFHIFHIFNNIKPHILLYEMITKQCNVIEVDVQSLQM